MINYKEMCMGISNAEQRSENVVDTDAYLWYKKINEGHI